MPDLGTPPLARLTWDVELAGGIHLPPTSGQVTWDELSIPSLRVDAILPHTDAAFDVADPLADARATVTATHSFTDQAGNPLNPGHGAIPDDVIVMDLGVRSRRRTSANDGQDLLALTLACDEAFATDYRTLTPVTLTGTTVREVVDEVLAVLGASPAAGTDDQVLPVEWDGAWDVGVTAWEIMRTACDTAGLILRCDEAGTWRLGYDWPSSSGTPINSSTIGESDYVSDLTDRDTEWFDAVVVEFRWTDSGGNDHVEYDTYAPGTPSRVLFESRPVPYSPGTAQNLYERTSRRGRSWTGRQAINLLARPGRSHITDFGGPQSFGVMSRVVWSITDSTMTVTSRSA